MNRTVKVEAAGLAFSQEGGSICIDNARADSIHWIGPDDAGYDDLVRLFHEARPTQAVAIGSISELAPMGPLVVCLCGSTRFGPTFHEANLRETLAGRIVLSIGCNLKNDTDLLLAGAITLEDKTRLDELHLRKIDLADEILVLNVGGYVGESTCREIAYAEAQGKPIHWWEPPKPETWERLAQFVEPQALDGIALNSLLWDQETSWQPEQRYKYPDLHARFLRSLQRIQQASDQEVADGYREEMLKLRMLNRFGRASEQFMGYPNTLRMNRCQRELKRRGLPVPPVDLP